MLECVNIRKDYYDRNSGMSFPVLQDCSLRLEEGRILGLMGGSGSGKSTLARILLRLIPADGGHIFYKNRDVTDFTERRLAGLGFRQEVQWISQRPEGAFDPLMVLGKSLVEPLAYCDRKWTEAMVGEVLDKVKLNRNILERYPHQVSGGELQRLNLARSLLLEPRVIIFDEPTSMLDMSVQAQVLHVLRDIQEAEGLSYIFISHDRDVLEWLTGDILRLEDGVLRRD